MADPQTAGAESWDRIAQQAIRGPLAKIIAGLETLSTDPKSALAPAAKHTAHGAITTARRLADMLESLLAVQRLGAGTAPVDAPPVSLATALDPAIRSLEVRARSEDIEFEWTVNEVGLTVAADEDLLRRAFRLAAERALDDVPKGGHLRASATPGGGAVRLRITGSAVADESVVFSQLEPVEIGFARLAVERMGGKFNCVRSAESGSAIDIILTAATGPAPSPRPVAAAAPVPAPAPAAPPPEPAETGIRLQFGGAIPGAPSEPAAAPVDRVPVPLPVPALPEPAGPFPAIHPDPAPTDSKLVFGPGRSKPAAATDPAPAAPPDPGLKIQFGASMPGAERPAAHHSADPPELKGMTITAPWTGTAKPPAPPAVEHPIDGSTPADRESPDAPRSPEPPAKAGGLKIVRHVDFDLMDGE